MYFRHAKRETNFGKLHNNLMNKLVFVCLIFFFVCVFFGDTCSTVHIPTVKVMLFFLNNEHKHLGDGWT